MSGTLDGDHTEYVALNALRLASDGPDLVLSAVRHGLRVEILRVRERAVTSGEIEHVIDAAAIKIAIEYAERKREEVRW